MSVIAALFRASWILASSYRLQFLFSLGALLVTVVPLFFVANALQPTMAGAIAGEGGNFFAFTLLGVLSTTLIIAAMRAPATAVSGGIGSGTLELMLSLPTPSWVVFAGLMSFDIAQAWVRALLLVVSGLLLGVSVVWSHFVPGLVVMALTTLAYFGIGLVSAAMVVAFRTSGPLLGGIMTVSSLLGGVYFPTHVIPSWVARVSDVIPLTYGLRATRRLWLDGAPLATVAADVAVLSAMAFATCAAGGWALHYTLRDARRRGSLGQY
ncbi:ABC transporter permease [Gemmatimonas sp.]|jgi:ABC-2 type transport system permease protein|uniref:ABC transporter permease n=1 Tax=Gemmatimonas sp. TaxID=1962908 RepID=UPI0022BAFAE6|nr:ABC transporter permease [Gemmatimonas sp.]MCZ8204297.1 ABC transporter permease [Gemmatimonas sp.]